ncbi:MAG: LuxR family transcriptional regulator, partial [Mycobacterium leprae]
RAFRGPVSQATVVAGDLLAAVTSLSDTQRQVLTALCRPFRYGAPYATPATNQQIGAELYLSVDAVKTHLRTLFHKFHIEDLPQNQKRAKLVERAFALGIVSRRDL